MKPRMVCSALLALSLAATLLVWLSPIAQGSGALAPKTIRCVNPGGTSGCFAQIQTAINASSYGDQINVASGWYTEHITMANGVSIYGEGWSNTIITGNFSVALPVVYFPGGIGATTVLSGVQVTGGGTGDPNTSPIGGGISVSGSPTIINTLVNNNTGNLGGGVAVIGASPTFNNVAVWSNRALKGGGFFLGMGSVVTITGDLNGIDGTVLWNSVSNGGYGGGVYMLGAKAFLSGLRIYWNTADYGGGVGDEYFNQSTLLLNDISMNSANYYGGGIYTNASDNIQIVANLINSNTAGDSGGGIYSGSTGVLLWNSLVGNTVTNASSFGGGAYIRGNGSKFFIQHNWFESNSARAGGGGLRLFDGPSALVDANTFVTNTARSAAGVGIAGAGIVTLTNNVIARNVIISGTNAGALEIAGTAPRVVNNTIADNFANGIMFYGLSGTIIVNNIVYHNANYGIERLDTSTSTLDYNDVYSNTVGDYDWTLSPGPHDLSVDPIFVGSGANLAAYYHLQATSPVSKTGSLAYAPSQDIDSEARMVCASMGADQLNCVTNRLYLPLIIK